MKTYKIAMSQELIDYIQRLHYDVSMRERIVRQLIQDGVDISSNPSYAKYQDELRELNAEYMMAQATAESQLLPVGFASFHNCKWVIDFSTAAFVVQLNGDDKEGEKLLLAKGFEVADA